jgi:ankyrin repeat protein
MKQIFLNKKTTINFGIKMKHIIIKQLCLGLILIASLNSLYAKTNNNVIKKPLEKVFLQAAKSNNVELLKHEIKIGVHVDSRDAKGRTALLVATYENAIDAARYLIQAGANVNAKDHLKDSPYLYAGAEGRLEILKMTVLAGANLKSINRYGGTALTPAAHHGHVKTVEYLLTTKIDVNQINYLGWTALLEAVVLGDGGTAHQGIVKLLLKAGANKNLVDIQGISPLQHAKNKGHGKIVILIQNH